MSKTSTSARALLANLHHDDTEMGRTDDDLHVQPHIPRRGALMPARRMRSPLGSHNGTQQLDDPRVHVDLFMTYEQWQSVMDALEPGATTQQVDDAQDTLNIVAPRAWLEAAEEREVQR